MNIDGPISQAWEGQLGSVNPISVSAIGDVAEYECPTIECKTIKSRNLNAKQFGRWSPWCSTAHYQRDYFRIKRARTHSLQNGKVARLQSDRATVIYN